MEALYKILFEVRLLHEYYLTDADTSTIFELPASGRTAFLSEKFRQSERSISSDIHWIIPDRALQMASNHHLRLLPTYSGFKVAIKVNALELPGNLTAYQPKSPLPAEFYLPVALLKRSHEIDSITASKTKRNLPSYWFFTNTNINGVKQHPWLTTPIETYNSSAIYEQGELAVGVPTFPANEIKSFFLNSLNIEQWISVPDGRYATDADRMVLKPDFVWRFSKSDGITDASFSLTNAAGDTIVKKDISTTGNFFENVPVSIDVRLINTIPDHPLNNNLIYTLSVTGNNGYVKNIKVIFFRELTINPNDLWGIVCIASKPGNSNFELLDSTNLLITRKNPDGTLHTPHPIFEIWVKSSLAYWRYKSNESTLQIIQNKHLNHCDLQAGILTTKLPKNISYTPTTFRNPDNTPHYLPNPPRYLPLRNENGKLFADIMVSNSIDMFPLGP